MAVKFDSFSNLAHMIHYHRKVSGLSRNELAQLAGIGKTAIFDIEHGKDSIRFTTLLRLLQVLNIDLCFESPLVESYLKFRKEDNHEES